MPQDSKPSQPKEGSRDHQQIADDNQQSGSVAQEGAGISNRPLEEEQENQERMPPRGETKEGSHA
jgi:hypothetical protein